MAMADFLADLGSGGFQGAGLGAKILGGLKTAGFATNPWLGGGIMAAGAGLGMLNAMDPAKRRAARINERLGKQEAAMNDLKIEDMKQGQRQDAAKRRNWSEFGNIFSGYLGAMAQAGGPRAL